MEHGFGGMFMIRVLIVFVFIYVVFIGIALNIAKSYRVKNGVINILEHNQIDSFDDDVFDDNGALANYFKKIPYVVSPKTNNYIDLFCKKKASESGSEFYSGRGTCIIKVGDSESYYYKAYVFMSVDFRFFNVNTTIPIGGETITMENT